MRKDSSERTPGPPVLALSGSKPSWRERQAQKEVESGSTSSAPGPGPATIPSGSEHVPRSSGYIPPQLRGDGARGRIDAQSSTLREDSSIGNKWRPRHRDPTRDGSPVESAKYVPHFKQDGTSRSETVPARTDSPAGSSGKYVPRPLRDKQ